MPSPKTCFHFLVPEGKLCADRRRVMAYSPISSCSFARVMVVWTENQVGIRNTEANFR